MRRTMAALQTLLLSVCAAAAAPKPKEDDKPVLYYPTRVGAKWVYDEGEDVTYEITAAEKKGEKTIITVETIGLKSKMPNEIVEVSADGLRLLQFEGHPIDPYWQLKLRAKVGDTWGFEFPRSKTQLQKGTMMLAETEEIEIPAGKFRAIRVDIAVTVVNQRMLPTPSRRTVWYAPNVGLVKMMDGPTTRCTLKSFTDGK